MALLELSRLLPEARRPLPPELVRIGDQSTYTLPATSFTGGSTTSGERGRTAHAAAGHPSLLSACRDCLRVAAHPSPHAVRAPPSPWPPAEAACMAVRDACQQLAERLRPHAAGLGPDFGWGQLMAAVKEAMGPWAGCKARGPCLPALARACARKMSGAACTSCTAGAAYRIRARPGRPLLLHLGRRRVGSGAECAHG
jgi:hypothetical protein